jgi:transcriptional regulator with XRE-family HTH domain
MISLSQFLKYKRQFKGLSLSQMASYLGILPRTYQKIEHDEPVRISVLKSVLKAHKRYKEAYQWVSQELDLLRQYH